MTTGNPWSTEYWSKSIADLGMGNADCGLQIEILVCNLCFSIRNPKSEMRNHPCSITPKSEERSGIWRNRMTNFEELPCC
jgi:hypothetical protein